MISIGTNVNSYNKTLTKPSILTPNVLTTGFNTLDYPPIPNGFTAFFVVKATGNTVNGFTSYFNKHLSGNMGTPLQMYNTSRNIGNGTLSNAIGSTHNFNTVTSTAIICVNKANQLTNSYSEYVNGTARTTYSRK